ncbi:MAG: sugar ABC transporter permease, partial [Actinobacteria bacterium]|nr:sugar ABC transporter permease [Actinomycetota bacterium]
MSVTLSGDERSAPQVSAGDRPRAEPREGNRHGRRRPWLGLLYLAPGLLLYTLVVLVPAGQSVWLSFFHWDG